jgi:hypothetical protein
MAPPRMDGGHRRRGARSRPRAPRRRPSGCPWREGGATYRVPSGSGAARPEDREADRVPHSRGAGGDRLPGLRRRALLGEQLVPERVRGDRSEHRDRPEADHPAGARPRCAQGLHHGHPLHRPGQHAVGHLRGRSGEDRHRPGPRGRPVQARRHWAGVRARRRRGRGRRLGMAESGCGPRADPPVEPGHWIGGARVERRHPLSEPRL